MEIVPSYEEQKKKYHDLVDPYIIPDLHRLVYDYIGGIFYESDRLLVHIIMKHKTAHFMVPPYLLLYEDATAHDLPIFIDKPIHSIDLFFLLRDIVRGIYARPNHAEIIFHQNKDFIIDVIFLHTDDTTIE